MLDEDKEMQGGCVFIRLSSSDFEYYRSEIDEAGEFS